jgi:hypothetical protein
MVSSGMNDKLRHELDSHSLQVHTWLKPAEVERIYGLKRDTVRKWYYRGHIPGFRLVEGLKFRRADVERIIWQRMPHLLERFKERSDQAESVS